MSYLDFYNKLDSMKEKEYIENFLVYNSSLVIAGIKPSATITLKKNNKRLYENWNIFGKRFIESIGLSFVELREAQTSIIALIYDKNVLYKELTKEYNTQFLIKLGYSQSVDVESYVKTLKSRYESYHCPHELGLFLGIPFEDVKDFMECTDKKCLLCGYWKVYNDSCSAQAIFNKYDEVKNYTKKKFVDGTLSYDLALSIKKYTNNSIIIK